MTEPTEAAPVAGPAGRVSLATIAREWGRIGCIGFGGPPTHIALLRRLCVDERNWMTATEFEDGVAAVNLLPGPASTQLDIYCAWRLRGLAGALIGGFCFIVPGLVLILGLAALFLAAHPPLGWKAQPPGRAPPCPLSPSKPPGAWFRPSWKRAGTQRSARTRWVVYALAGRCLGRPRLGPWLVLVLAACGLVEVDQSHWTARRQLGEWLLTPLPLLAGCRRRRPGCGWRWVALQGRGPVLRRRVSSSSRSCSTTPCTPTTG